MTTDTLARARAETSPMADRPLSQEALDAIGRAAESLSARPLTRPSGWRRASPPPPGPASSAADASAPPNAARPRPVFAPKAYVAPERTPSLSSAASPGLSKVEIRLSEEDAYAALESSLRMAPHIYRRTSSSAASLSRHLARTILGKFGEVGIARILERHKAPGIETFLGGDMFRVFDGTSAVDGDDFRLHGGEGEVSLDVKTSYEPNSTRLLIAEDQFCGPSAKSYYLAARASFPLLAEVCGKVHERGSWVAEELASRIRQTDPDLLSRLDRLVGLYAERDRLAKALESSPSATAKLHAKRARESVSADIHAAAGLLAAKIHAAHPVLCHGVEVAYLGIVAWRPLDQAVANGWSHHPAGSAPWAKECACVCLPLAVPASKTSSTGARWPLCPDLDPIVEGRLRPLSPKDKALAAKAV